MRTPRVEKIYIRISIPYDFVLNKLSFYEFG